MVPARRGDAPEILTLQLACWAREAILNEDLSIPPLHEDLADVEESVGSWDTYVVRVAGRLVGSVRGRRDGETWEVGRLMVAPDQRGRGLGRLLLDHVEQVAPAGVRTARLFTGKHSADNLRMYRKAGYRVAEVLGGPSGPVVLTKRISR
ncbi:GNAT family N-acetyltransferase [Nocardioides solisilvae]|uniref:GNAT family N-acetyltransferase n=1 Tax=Nocardioides solisilvae TaxID=1542435 RepID=UPI001EF44463|nr:GNAT family N-acetyltransferase [Nocardioides solisilvae]